MSYLVISCPHCNQKIFTLETDINCKIFRCGILKSDYSQIDPHGTKEHSDFLVKQNLIYGCGKQYELIKNNNNNIWEPIKCFSK
jgi:hypothetical protein